MKTGGYVKLISSVDTNNSSKLEMNVLPGEKTPWHYHTLFTENFEILKGSLEVGKGKNIYQLKQGDTATIEHYERHYFHNVSNRECVINVTLSVGNKNFENSLFIYKGLAQDGLSSSAGTPKKFSDLVLFVYLNNSKMLGIKKIAGPIFDFFAKKAIKRGYLNNLVQRYCK